MKHKTMIALAAGQAVRSAGVDNAIPVPPISKEKLPRKLSKRMSPAMGAFLDVMRQRMANTISPAPAKINFRRSDPRHPKHVELFHQGKPCDCPGAAP